MFSQCYPIFMAVVYSPELIVVWLLEGYSGLGISELSGSAKRNQKTQVFSFGRPLPSTVRQ